MKTSFLNRNFNVNCTRQLELLRFSIERCRGGREKNEKCFNEKPSAFIENDSFNADKFHLTMKSRKYFLKMFMSFCKYENKNEDTKSKLK